MKASGVLRVVGAVALVLALSACDDTYRRVVRTPYQPPCTLPAPHARLRLVPSTVPDSVLATHPTASVSVRVSIDSSGAVVSADILTPPSALDSFARAAALASVWEPAPQAATDTLSLYGCDPVAGPSFGCFVYYEEAPTLVDLPAPVYPDPARLAGIEGTVKVQILIGLDGRVWCSRVVKSIQGLDEAAVDAVWLSTWLPAKNNGSPVAVWAEVPIRFSLNGLSTASP